MILLSPAGIPSYPESSSKSKVDGKLEQALEMEIGIGSPSGSEEDSDDDDEPSTSTGPRKIQTFKGPTGDSGKLMKKLYSWMWEVSVSSRFLSLEGADGSREEETTRSCADLTRPC